MRLFFVTFAAICGCYLLGGAIWSFVKVGAVPPWAGFVAIAILIAVVFGGIGYLEISKYDIQDRVRSHRNKGSAPLGLGLAAVYFGYSGIGKSGAESVSDVDTFSGGDFGGDVGGGPD